MELACWASGCDAEKTRLKEINNSHVEKESVDSIYVIETVAREHALEKISGVD